jgi:hypothetical protein
MRALDVSTADLVTIAVGIGGLIASVLLGLQNNKLASQQNEIFREQNRIFAAQVGIEMPETIPTRKNKLGLYWPALAALIVALAVGVIVANLQITAPKPVDTIAVAVPWTLAVILVFTTVYLWKRWRGPDLRIEELRAQMEQLRAESVSIAVNGKLIAGPVAFEEERRKAQVPAELLSPLQIEALTLAKELRDFYAAHPFPDLPDPDFEMEQESLRRLIDTRADKQAKWRQKLLHAYANRGFGPRITALMHRLGEDFEYPVFNAKVAEDLRVPMKDTIPILAQHMEMLAIWINRKERGEVDLLHPKS